MKHNSSLSCFFRFFFFFFLVVSVSCAQKPKGEGEAQGLAVTGEAGDDADDAADSGDDAGEPDEARPADSVVVKEDEEEEKTPAKPQTPEVPLTKDKAEAKQKITEVENESLGDPQKKTLGLFGDLKACRMALASKANGGSGQLFWDEPGDRLSEKWLSSTQAEIKEYQAILKIVQHRRDYLKSELASCHADLAKAKTKSPEGVIVTEGDSDNDERVHQYMCRFVKKGASLRNFLIQTFSRGILQLENFDISQEFLVASLKDSKGNSEDNGLMFMGWRLAFDKGPITLNDIIFNNKDASLEHWAFLDHSKVPNAKECLKRDAGRWNP